MFAFNEFFSYDKTPKIYNTCNCFRFLAGALSLCLCLALSDGEYVLKIIRKSDRNEIVVQVLIHE